MKVYVAASLLAMLIGSSAQTAFATDSRDPNLDHYFHGRPHVQISDDSPIVTVVRKPPQAPNWAIDPTLPVDQAPPTIRIQVGTQGGSPGGTVMVGPNSLPYAGSSSNMSSLKAPPARLPNGQVGNHMQPSLGVQAQLTNKGHNQGQSANAVPMTAHAPSRGADAYATEPGYGTGHSQVRATTATAVTLTHRGELIRSK